MAGENFNSQCSVQDCLSPSAFKGMCVKCYKRDHYQRNKPAYVAARKRRAQRARQDYQEIYRYQRHGLTKGSYEEIWKAQGEKCAICRLSGEPGWRGWCIDHDHTCCSGSESCGQCVRGILCGHCNSLLGMAKDSVNTLEAAIDYLLEYTNGR